MSVNKKGEVVPEPSRWANYAPQYEELTAEELKELHERVRAAFQGTQLTPPEVADAPSGPSIPPDTDASPPEPTAPDHTGT